jgi:hypothetical protein
MGKNDKILEKLRLKSVTKQAVYRINKEVFKELKECAQKITKELSEEMANIDSNVEIKFTEKGDFEVIIQFSGDVLIFHMHTNTFTFDETHHIWKTSYVKEDSQRAYCGVINVYNFLSDSFKFNRQNDLGFLIGRIFINKDRHFFTEGNGKLGHIYNNFQESIIDENLLKEILRELMLYAMDFELQTPAFKDVQVVSMHQIMEMSHNIQLKTAKKLGYRQYEKK